MDGSVTVPKSVFCNGQWATAHWMVDVVDDSTGEMIITATVLPDGQGAPVVAALRMDMGLARELRAMAGFGVSVRHEEYDCWTTGERLAQLEHRMAAMEICGPRPRAGGYFRPGGRLIDIEQRLAALEAWQIAVAQDGEGDDTLFRIYDAINRAERAKAAGGA